MVGHGTVSLSGCSLLETVLLSRQGHLKKRFEISTSYFSEIEFRLILFFLNSFIQAHQHNLSSMIMKSDSCLKNLTATPTVKFTKTTNTVGPVDQS